MHILDLDKQNKLNHETQTVQTANVEFELSKDFFGGVNWLLWSSIKMEDFLSKGVRAEACVVHRAQRWGQPLTQLKRLSKHIIITTWQTLKLDPQTDWKLKTEKQVCASVNFAYIYNFEKNKNNHINCWLFISSLQSTISHSSSGCGVCLKVSHPTGCVDNRTTVEWCSLWLENSLADRQVRLFIACPITDSNLKRWRSPITANLRLHL